MRYLKPTRGEVVLEDESEGEVEEHVGDPGDPADPKQLPFKQLDLGQNHCTMPFPMSIEILEILKSKNQFLAHFDLKTVIFPLYDAEGPKF